MGGSQLRSQIVKPSLDPTKPPMMLGRILSDPQSTLDADKIIEISKTQKASEAPKPAQS